MLYICLYYALDAEPHTAEQTSENHRPSEPFKIGGFENMKSHFEDLGFMDKDV